MLNAEMVKAEALRLGADAVGIGSLDRFDGAPPEMDPRFIAPRAKSLICMIFRIPRGYLRGCEEGTHFFQYPSMGYGGINGIYAPSVLYNTARFEPCSSNSIYPAIATSIGRMPRTVSFSGEQSSRDYILPKRSLRWENFTCRIFRLFIALK